MGQKTSQSLFQINKTLKWNSKYIEKKSKEYYLYTSKDLEVKKFIIKFFKDKGLTVQNCSLNYFNNNLKIFISYQQKKSTAKLINDINKLQKLKTKFCFKKRRPMLLKDFYAKKLKNSIPNRKIKKNINKKKHKNKKKKLKNTSPFVKKSKKILKTVKNSIHYENVNYKKYFRKINLKKKKKRIKFVKYYKKYFNLKINKNIKNVYNNNFLHALFQSLNLFYKKKLSLILILKFLSTNIKKNLKIKKERKILKKNLIRLQKYQRNDFFKEGINLAFSSITNKNSAELISNYIAINIKKLKKKHSFFLRFIKTLLKMFIAKTSNNIIEGIKIKLKGRINGARRSKQKIINIGKDMKIRTIDSSINYSEVIAYTLNGTIGVKVWVCAKN